MTCPECGSEDIEEIDQDLPWKLYQCQECRLTFENRDDDDDEEIDY